MGVKIKREIFFPFISKNLSGIQENYLKKIEVRSSVLQLHHQYIPIFTLFAILNNH